MSIHPILSTLMRHRTAAGLIVLEIALSCAIISNAIFLISSRVAHMQRTSGIAETELVFISSSSLRPGLDANVMRREDLAALLAVPGVRAASSVNQIPFGANAWGLDVRLEPDQADPTLNISAYMDDGHLTETLGLRLIEGRTFEADEYQELSAIEASDGPTRVASALLSRALAKRLFPGASALGRDLYVWGDAPTRVIGVIEDLMVPGSWWAPAETYYSVLFPARVSNGDYALRTEPRHREDVLDAAVAALNAIDPNRIISLRKSVEDMRNDYYSRDRAVVWLLLAVCASLLAVTAFGIVGLTSFWVQQRTRQIGIRRALGATRGQVLRYFQMENFLLSGAGIALGLGLAFALNQWLMAQYELARLPLAYLPLGALTLWLLGQIAVLGPARRAACVPPAVATRSA